MNIILQRLEVCIILFLRFMMSMSGGGGVNEEEGVNCDMATVTAVSRAKMPLLFITY